MNTLQQRYQARLPYTHAGPSLVAIRPGFAASGTSGKVSGETRGGVGRDLPWEAVTDPRGDSGGGRRALPCRQMAPCDRHRARPGHAGDARGGGCAEDTRDRGRSGTGGMLGVRDALRLLGAGIIRG